MNYDALCNELKKAKYAEMTDEQVVEALNAETESESVDSVSGADIFAAVTLSDYQAMSDEARQLFAAAVAMPDVPVGDGKLALLGLKGSTTESNLESLETKTASLAAKLGLGRVKLGAVQVARKMMKKHAEVKHGE